MKCNLPVFKVVMYCYEILKTLLALAISNMSHPTWKYFKMPVNMENSLVSIFILWEAITTSSITSGIQNEFRDIWFKLSTFWLERQTIYPGHTSPEK